MRKVAVLFILLALFVVTPKLILAKRTLPKVTPVAGGAVKNPTRVGIAAKFRADRKALVVTFTNLSVASSINYTLTYDSNGITQAAGGSVAIDSPEPVVRELLFGTCSGSVCRYDTGITNAKLVVTTVLKSGKKVIRTFKLRI